MEATKTERCVVSYTLSHDSRFLGLRLKSPVTGEAARLLVSLQNAATLDIPAAGWRVILRWSDGTEFAFDQNLGPVLRGDSDDKTRTFARLGPFDFAVRIAGVLTIFLDPAGAWPTERGFRFVDANGVELPYNPEARRVTIGAARATTWQIIYQKLAILIGILTLASVIITRAVLR